MKLTSIAATVVHPRNSSSAGIPIVEIRTDEGLTGWGEAQASRTPGVVCDIVRDLLSPALKDLRFGGERAEIESLWDGMYDLMRDEGQTGGFLPEAISAVDIAIWDLAGKARQLPVSRIAGLAAANPEVEAFAPLARTDSASLRDTVSALRDSGFRTFEVPYDGAEDQWIAALGLCRKGLPEGGRLAANARWRLDPGDFLLQRRIDDCGLLWLANPLPPEDPFAHGRLAKTICTSLALGEAYHTHHEIAPFFHEQAVGVLQPDLGRCGLTEAFRMARMAAGHDIRVSVRVGESLGPQLAAALQFASMEPDRPVEYSPRRLKTANLALSAPIEVKQGKYQVPRSPGLGIQIEEPELHLMETQAA